MSETPDVPFDEWKEAAFPAEAIKLLEMVNAVPDQIWRNSRYQVLIRKDKEDERQKGCPVDMIWLSIKRNDRGPVRDWRDMQRIKNELVGPEFEGVELYPAESRCQDGANQYHMWVIPKEGQRFPFGFTHGVQHDGETIFGETQRKFEHPPTMTPSEGPPNEPLEAYKKRVSEEATASTKSKYVYADMHVEAYKKLRKGLEEILDLHPLHDGYFHEGSSTGPRACKMDEIDEYILKKVAEQKEDGWETVCRRTNDPKLAWLEKRYAEMGIPTRRNGHSFHAPILQVPTEFAERAYDYLNETYDGESRYRKDGEPDTVDDIEDDDPVFKED